MKGLVYVILIFLLYWIGLSFLALFPMFWGCLPILSNHIGRYVFVIPFLYVLFKKTGITFFPDTKENTRFPLLNLFVLGLLLFAIGFLHEFFFSPYVNVNAKLTVAEAIAINFSLIIMGPITEELFFRKWMISYLEKANVKPLYIMCLTTLLFAIPHTDTTIWYFRFDTIIFGIVLYHVFVKYRDVRYCIFVHFVLNLTSTIVHIVSQYL